MNSTDSAKLTTATDAETQLGRATLAKVGWRLLPFLLLLYVVAWLDRVNIGFAALQMKPDLGFSDTVYGFGAGIFFIGYALVRGAEQPDSRARRRAVLDRAHHDHVGDSLGR